MHSLTLKYNNCRCWQEGLKRFFFVWHMLFAIIPGNVHVKIPNCIFKSVTFSCWVDYACVNLITSITWLDHGLVIHKCTCCNTKHKGKVWVTFCFTYLYRNPWIKLKTGLVPLCDSFMIHKEKCCHKWYMQVVPLIGTVNYLFVT